MFTGYGERAVLVNSHLYGTGPIMGQQLAFPPWLLLSMHLDSHLEVGLKRAVPPPPLLLLPILAARSIGEMVASRSPLVPFPKQRVLVVFEKHEPMKDEKNL